MDSIDIYISLLDDIEVSRELKIFNEKTKSANAAFKKTKLLKILRGQISQVKIRGRSNKYMPNPFECIIFKQKDDLFQDLSEKEFFFLMNDIKMSKYPDYKKFANALIYFPEKTKQLIPEVSENIRNNRKLFYGLFYYDNCEELESYLTQFSLFSRDKWKNDIEKIFFCYFNEKEKQRSREIMEVIAQDSLKDFYERINNDKNEIPLYVYQYVYLMTHKDVNESIKHCFIEEIMASLMQKGYEKINELNKRIDKAKNQSYAENAEELKIVNEKKLKDQLGKYIQSKKEMEDKLKEEINNFKSKLDKVQKNYDSKLNCIQSENEELKKILNEIQQYKDYAFPKSEDKSFEFAVVHYIEIKLASIIYPEVLFIPAEEWVNNVQTFPQDVNTVYIAREGLTNRQIKYIEKDATKRRIKTKIISAGNEKDLIENIAILRK